MSEHARECPLHEDNPIEHRCPSQCFRLATVEWNNNDWRLCVKKAVGYPIAVPIDYCPFCGEELLVVSCKCHEIAERLKRPRQ